MTNKLKIIFFFLEKKRIFVKKLTKPQSFVKAK